MRHPGIVIALFAGGCCAGSSSPVVKMPTDLLYQAPPGHGAPAPCGSGGEPFVVSGTVRTEDGNPAEGVAVGPSVVCSETFAPLARTDARGHYEVSIRGPVRFTVLDLRSDPGEVMAEPGGGPYDFTVDKGCTRTTTVVAEDGTPIAGVEVTWGVGKEGLRSVSVFPEGPFGRTDADGRAEVPLAPCRADMPWLRKDGELLRFDPSVPGRLVVLSSGVVEGTVRDQNGAPVPWADVHVGGVDGLSVDMHRTRTDADGRWAVHVAPDASGVVSVRATAVDGSSSSSSLASPAAGARVTANITLGGTREVTLGCAGLDGDRCSTLDVSAVKCREDTPNTRDFGDCRHEDRSVPARTVCRCPVGEARIDASDRVVVVPAGVDWAWLDFRTGFGTVTGEVVPPTGTRAEDCIVDVHIPEESIVTSALLGRPIPLRHELAPGSDGRFTEGGLAPGTWKVWAYCGPGAAKTVEVEIGTGTADVGTIRL